MAPNSVSLPEDALAKRSELTSGAWRLYETYCKYRDPDTGYCDPSLRILSKEIGRVYHHVSNLKRELVLEGWIRRRGRHAVELLVGDFPAPKVRAFVKNNLNEGPPSLRKIATKGGFVKNNLNEADGLVKENLNEESQLPPHPPNRIKELNTEEAAATPAANEICDDAFAAQLAATKLYPDLDVWKIWEKLRRRCLALGETPTRGRLVFWCDTERPSQQRLPGIPGQVAPADFRTATYFRPAVMEGADPSCPLCRGGGWKTTAERLAIRCECLTRTPESSPDEKQEERHGTDG